MVKYINSFVNYEIRKGELRSQKTEVRMSEGPNDRKTERKTFRRD